MRTAKTLIRLGRCPLARLIWIFAGRTVSLLVLSCCGSNHFYDHSLPVTDSSRAANAKTKYMYVSGFPTLFKKNKRIMPIDHTRFYLFIYLFFFFSELKTETRFFFFFCLVNCLGLNNLKGDTLEIHHPKFENRLCLFMRKWQMRHPSRRLVPGWAQLYSQTGNRPLRTQVISYPSHVVPFWSVRTHF